MHGSEENGERLLIAALELVGGQSDLSSNSLDWGAFNGKARQLNSPSGGGESIAACVYKEVAWPVSSILRYQ